MSLLTNTGSASAVIYFSSSLANLLTVVVNKDGSKSLKNVSKALSDFTLLCRMLRAIEQNTAKKSKSSRKSSDPLDSALAVLNRAWAPAESIAWLCKTTQNPKLAEAGNTFDLLASLISFWSSVIALIKAIQAIIAHRQAARIATANGEFYAVSQCNMRLGCAAVDAFGDFADVVLTAASLPVAAASDSFLRTVAISPGRLAPALGPRLAAFLRFLSAVAVLRRVVVPTP